MSTAGTLREPFWKRFYPGSAALVILSLIVTIPFFHLATLPTAGSSMPVLAIEFPGTANTALAILRVFVDAGELDDLRTAVRWDFALIVTYVVAYLSLLKWLQERSGDELFPHAIRGVWIAGTLDAIEDICILFLIAHVNQPEHGFFGVASLLTTLFALFKWTLLLAVTCYSLWEIFKRIDGALKS